MALMDQLPADGPSATWTSKQAQLVAGWVSAKATTHETGSLTCQMVVLALGGSITRALISGQPAPALSLDRVSHLFLTHPQYFLSIAGVSTDSFGKR